MGSVKNPDLQIKNEEGEVRDLSLLHFLEDNVHIIYCPAFDISGYGTTEKEAFDSFNIGLQEFFSDCQDKKSFFENLKPGWRLEKEDVLTAPSWFDMLQKNDALQELLEQKHFRKFNQGIRLPDFI